MSAPQEKTHRFQTSFHLHVWDGSETEMQLVIRYTVSPGSPEVGRFGPPEGYDPGSPDELNIVSARLIRGDGTCELDLPDWLEKLIRDDEALADSVMSDWREMFWDGRA